MKHYTIKFNYNASIVVDVEAEDEGDALGKARIMAEDADISEFTLGNEGDTKILNVKDI